VKGKFTPHPYLWQTAAQRNILFSKTIFVGRHNFT
jgi:hypothetical protein